MVGRRVIYTPRTVGVVWATSKTGRRQVGNVQRSFGSVWEISAGNFEAPSLSDFEKRGGSGPLPFHADMDLALSPSKCRRTPSGITNVSLARGENGGKRGAIQTFSSSKRMDGCPLSPYHTLPNDEWREENEKKFAAPAPKSNGCRWGFSLLLLLVLALGEGAAVRRLNERQVERAQMGNRGPRHRD